MVYRLLSLVSLYQSSRGPSSPPPRAAAAASSGSNLRKPLASRGGHRPEETAPPLPSSLAARPPLPSTPLSPTPTCCVSHAALWQPRRCSAFKCASRARGPAHRPRPPRHRGPRALPAPRALSALGLGPPRISASGRHPQKTEVRVERVLYWQHGGALGVSRAVASPCVA